MSNQTDDELNNLANDLAEYWLQTKQHDWRLGRKRLVAQAAAKILHIPTIHRYAQKMVVAELQTADELIKKNGLFMWDDGNSIASYIANRITSIEGRIEDE